MQKFLFLLLATLLPITNLASPTNTGYYRYPTLRGDTVVFTSHGDLFKVNVAGGEAHELTAHAGQETDAKLSPDGKSVAFRANYEGVDETYVMPSEGPANRDCVGEAVAVKS